MKVGRDFIGVGCGALIFNKKGEILLQKRGGESKNEVGIWSKPGGAVDFGETAKKALKREVLEETGLKIEIWGLLPHTDHIIEKDKQHWVALNYLSNSVVDNFENKEPQKCSKMQWFNLSDLPKNLTQTTKEAVENYSKGRYIKV